MTDETFAPMVDHDKAKRVDLSPIPVVAVSLDAICTDRVVNDRHYDDGHDQESMLKMMNSISSRGLVHPVVLQERHDGGYTLVAGSRRLEAFSRLEKIKPGAYTKIPAKVLPPDTPAITLALITLEENSRRLRPYDRGVVASWLITLSLFFPERPPKDNTPDGRIQLGREIFSEYQNLELTAIKSPQSIRASDDDTKIIMRCRNFLDQSGVSASTMKRKIHLLDFPPVIQRMLSEKVLSMRRCTALHRLKQKNNGAFNEVIRKIKEAEWDPIDAADIVDIALKDFSRKAPKKVFGSIKKKLASLLKELDSGNYTQSPDQMNEAHQILDEALDKVTAKLTQKEK